MIDPIISAQRTERPQAARALPARSAQSRAAQRPAHATKILAAGISTSLVLGIVSYLGNSAAQASNNKVSVPTAPTGNPATVPTGATTPFTPVTVATTPAVPGGVATAPAQPQVIAVAVPVPVAPPVAAPQPAAPPVVTSGTTSASG